VEGKEGEEVDCWQGTWGPNVLNCQPKSIGAGAALATSLNAAPRITYSDLTYEPRSSKYKQEFYTVTGIFSVVGVVLTIVIQYLTCCKTPKLRSLALRFSTLVLLIFCILAFIATAMANGWVNAQLFSIENSAQQFENALTRSGALADDLSTYSQHMLNTREPTIVGCKISESMASMEPLQVDAQSFQDFSKAQIAEYESDVKDAKMTLSMRFYMMLLTLMFAGCVIVLLTLRLFFPLIVCTPETQEWKERVEVLLEKGVVGVLSFSFILVFAMAGAHWTLATSTSDFCVNPNENYVSGVEDAAWQRIRLYYATCGYYGNGYNEFELKYKDMAKTFKQAKGEAYMASINMDLEPECRSVFKVIDDSMSLTQAQVDATKNVLSCKALSPAVRDFLDKGCKLENEVTAFAGLLTMGLFFLLVYVLLMCIRPKESKRTKLRLEAVGESDDGKLHTNVDWKGKWI